MSLSPRSLATPRAGARWLCTLLPVVGIAAADAALASAFCPAEDRAALGVQFALHACATWAFFGLAWGWVAVASASGAGGGVASLSRGWRAGVLLGAGLSYALFDRLFAATTFTGHYAVLLPRVAAALVALGLLVASAFAPARVAVLARRPASIALALAAALCLVGLAFGFSWSRWTTKHFREFGHALVVYPWAVWCMLDALHGPRRTLAGALATLGCAALLMVGSLSLAAALPERSTYAVVTRSWGTAALRRLNRSVARELLGGYGGTARLSGEPVRATPARRVPSGRVACRSVGPARAQSVMIITLDSLRADYFGVARERLPQLERLRAESRTFTRAIQAASGTGPSLFALHTGRYATAGSATSDVLRAAAQSGGLVPLYETQAWSEHPEAFATRLLADIARLGDRRFLAHYHVLSLHPRRNWAGSGFDYGEVLVRLDGMLGRILSQLRASGVLERTLLVVTADHGEELGFERGYQGHGFDVTQSLLHTPLMLRMPGLAAEQRDELASGTDVAPTVLDALGMRCELPMHGRSLLRAAAGDRSVFGSSYAPGLLCGGDCRVYADNHAVLSGGFKLILERGENARALFDLGRDPAERDNLIDAQPERAKRLLALLRSYLAGELPAAGP